MTLPELNLATIDIIVMWAEKFSTAMANSLQTWLTPHADKDLTFDYYRA